MVKTIGIVGLGLIGGSLGKAIKSKMECQVLGYDIDELTLETALQEKSIDGILKEPSQCDIIIVALFPEATIKYILDNVSCMKEKAIVMDICGMKKPIADAVAQTCKSYKVEFVGGHPMAGKACWGYNFSSPDLFKDSSMIITPIFTDSWAIEVIQELCKAIGFSRIVFTDPESHDKMIGYTSQLAHILSSAYIKNPLCMNYKGYTGGSFQDLTRVAKLNPEMWSELFLMNSNNLIKDLDVLIGSITDYRDAIAAGEREKLTQLLSEGTQIKEKLMEE